jgi:SsrA-binding protein
MHKKEIRRLDAKVRQEGLTLVPLSLYFRNSLVKMELGLCKGKKLYDKRNDAAEKSARREIDRKLKEANA